RCLSATSRAGYVGNHAGLDESSLRSGPRSLRIDRLRPRLPGGTGCAGGTGGDATHQDLPAMSTAPEQGGALVKEDRPEIRLFRGDGDPPPEVDAGVYSFDLEFRKEVAQYVHDLLKRCYVTRRRETKLEANRRGVSLEQLVAAAIAHRIMRKV